MLCFSNICSQKQTSHSGSWVASHVTVDPLTKGCNVRTLSLAVHFAWKQRRSRSMAPWNIVSANACGKVCVKVRQNGFNSIVFHRWNKLVWWVCLCIITENIDQRLVSDLIMAEVF